MSTYAESGVSIDAADQTVNLIRKLAQRTHNAQVLTSIGSFGAGYQLGDNVLVSSADGVGTKLRLAVETGRHDTIGECLVNHCVNDIAVQGAVPLFFLDYFATGQLVPKVAASVISGISRGCVANQCALIGGETAEMPGMYQGSDYDLAGFIVGSVPRDQLLTGEHIQPGDALLALPSNGLHTNGYSLARQVLSQHYQWDSYVPELSHTLADELLKVHQSYLPVLRQLSTLGLLGAAHITGGGITDNTPRMLSADLTAVIDTATWQVPAIFKLIRELGSVPEADWRRTFNLGVGMIVCLPSAGVSAVSDSLTQSGISHWQIGHVAARVDQQSQVQYV